MKKEFLKMRLKAVGKILFSLVLVALLVWVTMEKGEEIGTGPMIFVDALWGIVVLIYMISGIKTLFGGNSEALDYIRRYPGGESRLNEEYKAANKIGNLLIGDIHAFVNASDGFHIVRLVDVGEVTVKRHGHNPRRAGYYYLYINRNDKGDVIKVYYISQSGAHNAADSLELAVKAKWAYLP